MGNLLFHKKFLLRGYDRHRRQTAGGAKVIHNHPGSKDYYGDCFSMNDFRTFFGYRLKRLEVISGLGRYSLEYEGKPISSEKSELLYKNAELYVMDRALQTGKKLNLCS